MNYDLPTFSWAGALMPRQTRWAHRLPLSVAVAGFIIGAVLAAGFLVNL